jgi:hypothetical protein
MFLLLLPLNFLGSGAQLLPVSDFFVIACLPLSLVLSRKRTHTYTQ